MKSKKLLLVIPAVILAVSCNSGGSTKQISYKISKLDLSNNTSTLLLGKIASSNATTNKLISLNKKTTNEETTTETADEVDYTVEATDGTTTTTETTENVTVNSLVRLSKRFAVVEAVYKTKTYALIVDLKDGKCYEFPDANVLPNVKKSKISYINSRVVQFGNRVFYYLHQDSNNIRKIYKLTLTDIENGTSPTLTCVTPDETETVASFAVSGAEDIVYSTYDTPITGEETELTGTFTYKYKPVEDDIIGLTISDDLKELKTYYSDFQIMPLFYRGLDGCLYTYLKCNTILQKAAYFVGTITYTPADEESGTEASCIVNIPKYQEAFVKALSHMPEKILKFSSAVTDGEKTNIISQIVSFGKEKVTDNKLIQSISKITNSFKSNSISKPHPHRPDPVEREEDVSENTITDTSSETILESLTDGFEGSNHIYFFGVGKDAHHHLKKVKYNGSGYEVVNDILSTYFQDLENIETVVEDDEESITVVADGDVVVADSDGEEVTIEDESGTETKIENVEEAVDVSNADDISETDE